MIRKPNGRGDLRRTGAVHLFHCHRVFVGRAFRVVVQVRNRNTRRRAAERLAGHPPSVSDTSPPVDEGRLIMGRTAQSRADLGASIHDTGQRNPTRWSVALEWLPALLPPITLLTALATWYGYELILTRGRYFGLDPSVLEFSTRDYVFRSASAVLGPLLYLLVALVGLVLVHAGVSRALRRPHLNNLARRAAVILLAAGMLLAVEGLRVISDETVLSSLPVLRTLFLPAGALLVSYGIWMLVEVSEAKHRLQPWERVGWVLAAGVIVVSVFWCVSVAAEAAGMRDSYRLYQGHLRDLPKVVLYSSKPLSIEGPGIDVTPIPDPSAAYHWRYTGLRLLVYSSGKYFLLPSGWASTGDSAIVLRDEPGLRFEFQEPDRLVRGEEG